MSTPEPRYTAAEAGEPSKQLDRAQQETERDVADRAQAVEETAGSLTRVYEPGELERLRADWPE